MKKKNIRFRFTIRALALVLALLTMPHAMPVFAAGTAKKEANASNYLKTGVYRIKNELTGLYIDCYDLAYEKNGSAYIETKNGGEAQDIYVERQADGTYTLSPQSEGGKYALSCKNGVENESVITKNKEKTAFERFAIYASKNGAYTIAPIKNTKEGLVLDISEKTSRYKDNYICLKKFDGNSSQLWRFEPIETTGVSLSFSNTKMKIWSVGTLHATLKPYNFTSNDVKWSSDNPSVLMIDKNGNYAAISAGKAKVTASLGGKSATCTVTVSEESAFTWYSQHSTKNSDWDGTALSGITFTSGGVRKKFMIDKYGRGSDWMDEGCYLSSIAMVLNNMGARLTEGYDFRSGQSGDLPADPYTVALANSGNLGATTSKGSLSGNPILVSRSNIESRFNVGGRAVYSKMTYDVSNKAIKEALDEHPEGVIIYFSRPSKGRTHYIVFTKCLNPDETNPRNYKFEVCDSASYDAARGDHVPFEKCISYTSEGYRMSSAVSMICWYVAD